MGPGQVRDFCQGDHVDASLLRAATQQLDMSARARRHTRRVKPPLTRHRRLTGTALLCYDVFYQAVHAGLVVPWTPVPRAFLLPPL